jgi:hypothetical protein
MIGIIFGLITFITYLRIRKANRWKELCEIPKPSLVNLDYRHPMGMVKIHTLKIVSTDDNGVFYRTPIPIPPGGNRKKTVWKEGELEWMEKDEFLSQYLKIHPKKTLPSTEKFEFVKEFETIMETEYGKISNEAI